MIYFEHMPKDICPPIFELDENGIPVNSKYNSEEEYFDGHFTLVETLCLECKVLGYCRKGLLTNFPKPN
jgi:hypothetical protein